MRNTLYVMSFVGLTVLLGACGTNHNSADNSGGGGSASNPPPSQSPSGLDYTTFVKQTLKGTSDTNDALPVNSLTFEYNDESNTKAYEDVLGSGS